MITIITIGERIRYLRTQKNMTQKELADICNVKPNQISQYESDSVTPPDDIKIKIANYFDVSLDYLYGRTQVDAKDVVDKEIVRLPIVGSVRAGAPILAVQNIEGYQVIERKYLDPGYEYFFLRIKGDSMNVIAPEDSLVLVRKQNTVDNGDIAVVLVNQHEATIKKFFQQNGCITLVPMSTNPEHQPQVYDPRETEIEIIGKAVKVINQTNL